MSPACLVVRTPLRIAHIGEQKYVGLSRSWGPDTRIYYHGWLFAWRSQ